MTEKFEDVQPNVALEMVATFLADCYDEDGDYNVETEDAVNTLEAMFVARGLLAECDECGRFYATGVYDECPTDHDD